MSFTIERITEASPELLEDIANLMPQLSAKRSAPTYQALEASLASPAFFLMAARDTTTRRVVGIGTFTVAPLLTGTKAYLEGLVVDKPYQDQGIAKALTVAVFDEARNAGVQSLELTSAPHRITAHHVYVRMGFEKRDTNVYRLKL